MTETKNEMYVIYGIGIVVVLMLGWAFYGFIAAPQQAAQINNVNDGAQATFSQPNNGIDSECGDLNDKSTVEHLGHHPDQFADCLKKVNPQFLKQTTGKTLAELLGNDGMH